jgi:hypothetical protein
VIRTTWKCNRIAAQVKVNCCSKFFSPTNAPFFKHIKC